MCQEERYVGKRKVNLKITRARGIPKMGLNNKGENLRGKGRRSEEIFMGKDDLEEVDKEKILSTLKLQQ